MKIFHDRPQWSMYTTKNRFDTMILQQSGAISSMDRIPDAEEYAKPMIYQHPHEILSNFMKNHVPP